MGRDNSNLSNARQKKNDEFYTLYSDIAKEMVNYKPQFEGKIIYCPCDDEESNFVKFFINHFEDYKLKHLVATSLNGERIDYDGITISHTPLKGNGDFRSEEIKEIAKESDMIVTNPPFSLFRAFIKFLEEVG